MRCRAQQFTLAGSSTGPAGPDKETTINYLRSRAAKKIAALSTTLLLGASVLAACEIGSDGNKDTAAKVLPENTQFFASVALNPSADQRLALYELSQKFPREARAESEDSVPRDFINDILGEEGSELNYDQDIKPWLGAEAAFAVIAPANEGDDPMAVALVKTKDEAATKAAIEKDGSLTAEDYRFMGEYLVVADSEDETQREALNVVEAGFSAQTHLSDLDKYNKAIDGLNGEHLVLGYADVAGLARTIAASDSVNEDTSAFSDAYGLNSGGDDEAATEDLLAETDKIGEVAFSLYATTNSIVLESVGKNVDGTANADGALLKNLPGDTLAALQIGTVGDRLAAELDANNPDSVLGKALADDSSIQQALDEPAVAAALDLARSIDGEVVVTAGDVSANVPEIGFVATTSKGQDATAALSELMAAAQDLGAVVEDANVAGGRGYLVSMPATEEATLTDGPFVYPPDDFATEDQFTIDPAFDSNSTFGQAASDDIKIAAVVVDGKIVIASTADYAGQLVANGDLGEQEAFKTAMGAEGRDNASSFYLDVDKLNTVINDAFPESTDQEDQEVLNTIKSIGVVGWVDGDTAHSEFRVIFK